MRDMRRAITTVGILSVALLPIIAAVSPEAATSALDTLPPVQMPVAIAQPLASMDGGPLVSIAGASRTNPVIPETFMLVLVGSALIGLASVVRRHS